MLLGAITSSTFSSGIVVVPSSLNRALHIDAKYNLSKNFKLSNSHLVSLDNLYVSFIKNFFLAISSCFSFSFFLNYISLFVIHPSHLHLYESSCPHEGQNGILLFLL